MESFDQVKELLEIREDIDKAFIIGGAQIFNYAMENGLCDVLLLTKIISPEFNCDTYCSYLAEENIKNHFFWSNKVRYNHRRWNQLSNYCFCQRSRNWLSISVTPTYCRKIFSRIICRFCIQILIISSNHYFIIVGSFKLLKDKHYNIKYKINHPF